MADASASPACERRQAAGRVEAVDRLHQVEDGVARHAGLGLAGPGDERGVGHVAAGEGRQHPGLAPHHLVAGPAQVAGAAAQHVVAAARVEPQQHVLGAAGQRSSVGDRPGGQPLVVHPPREGGEVDEVGADPGVGGHGRAFGRSSRRGAGGREAAGLVGDSGADSTPATRSTRSLVNRRSSVRGAMRARRPSSTSGEADGGEPAVQAGGVVLEQGADERAPAEDARRGVVEAAGSNSGRGRLIEVGHGSAGTGARRRGRSSLAASGRTSAPASARRSAPAVGLVGVEHGVAPGLDLAAVLHHHGPQQPVAVAEVVLERRGVAGARGPVDLPQADAVDAVDGEQLLGRADEPLGRGRRRRSAPSAAGSGSAGSRVGRRRRPSGHAHALDPRPAAFDRRRVERAGAGRPPAVGSAPMLRRRRAPVDPLAHVDPALCRPGSRAAVADAARGPGPLRRRRWPGSAGGPGARPARRRRRRALDTAWRRVWEIAHGPRRSSARSPPSTPAAWPTSTSAPSASGGDPSSRRCSPSGSASVQRLLNTARRHRRAPPPARRPPRGRRGRARPRWRWARSTPRARSPRRRARRRRHRDRHSAQRARRARLTPAPG